MMTFHSRLIPARVTALGVSIVTLILPHAALSSPLLWLIHYYLARKLFIRSALGQIAGVKAGGGGNQRSTSRLFCSALAR